MIQIKVMGTIWSAFARLNYVINPFVNLFKFCLTQNILPSEWKKAKVPVHKKKHCVKNYRPVSLFPICIKVFERIIYKNDVYVSVFYRKQSNIRKPIRMEAWSVIHVSISLYPWNIIQLWWQLRSYSGITWHFKSFR